MQNSKNLTSTVRRAMKGDSEAFAKLVESFGADILYNVSTQLDNPQDAEDVAQEVVIEMLRYIGALKSPRAFYAYLRKIIKNACVRHNTTTHDDRSVSDIDDHRETLLDDEKDRPQERLEQAQISEEIQAALQKLPDKQRETLYLYYFKELSYKEIAKVQGISINTVGVNVSKAKASLKKLMEMPMTQAGKKARSESESFELGGMAAAPLIAQAFADSMDKQLPSGAVERLVGFTKKMLAEAPEAAIAASGILSIRVFEPASAIFVSTIAVVAIATGGYFVGTAAVSLQAQYAVTESVFAPAANIVFDGEGSTGQRNPTNASAQTSEGELSSWRVLNSAGTQVLAGSGPETGAVLAQLPAGDYIIYWHIEKSATSDNSATTTTPAKVQRSFTIG